MIVQVLEQIAIDLGWTFNYGSTAWQNLSDFYDDTEKEEQQVHSLLFYVDREKKFNEYGAELPQKNYSGELWIAVRSDIGDVDYNTKFKDRIYPLLAAEADRLCSGLNACEGWSWVDWKMIEIHNELDTNIDGWKIKFKVKKS